MLRSCLCFGLFCLATAGSGQSAPAFWYGADLSYVQEMEDCGGQFIDGQTATDPYELFAAYGHNLVRLRLWHTPSWQDTLHPGKRYSDLADVREAIQRSHQAGMAVLLDLHLSDFWADPNRQNIPAAWTAVAGETDVLCDSLYRYVSGVLMDLFLNGLLPEMVQIGNETNREILLLPEADTAGHATNWDRNLRLFHCGLTAIRDVTTQTGTDIRTMIHIADPGQSQGLLDQFLEAGLDLSLVDQIGLSYYWQWHQPVTIPDVGTTIRALRNRFPGKEILVVEAGYPWTAENQDQAGNVLSEIQPGYGPFSPDIQLRWLTDLARTVQESGGTGVVYWEPAWISTPCRTPWGTGSHYENATFFDRDGRVLPDGGMGWVRTLTAHK